MFAHKQQPDPDLELPSKHEERKNTSVGECSQYTYLEKVNDLYAHHLLMAHAYRDLAYAYRDLIGT